MSNVQPPAEYAGLLGTIMEKVQQNLKAHDQLLPVAFLINLKKNKIDVVAANFADDAAKDFFAETVRQRASRFEAEAICFASEAWSLPEKYSTKEHMDRIYRVYGSLSNFPEREEIVMLSLQTHDGLWMATSRISTAKKGRKATGFKWMKSDGSDGRFTKLLPPKYATPEEVDTFLQLARYKMVEAGLDPDEKQGDRSLIQILESHSRNAPAARLTEEVLDALIQKFIKIRAGEEDGDSSPGAA